MIKALSFLVVLAVANAAPGYQPQAFASPAYAAQPTYTYGAAPVAKLHHAAPLAYAAAPIAKVHHAAPLAYAAPVAKVAVAAEPYDAHPQYNYGYSVSDSLTGDSKNHQESRDGDVVQGQYSLVEPDGAIRTVTYTADPVNGFNAVVDRSAPAVVKTVAPVVAKVHAAPVYAAQPVLKAHHAGQVYAGGPAYAGAPAYHF